MGLSQKDQTKRNTLLCLGTQSVKIKGAFLEQRITVISLQLFSILKKILYYNYKNNLH